MKKDCAYTRKSLRKYLRGHLFKYEQIRVARHLNACPLCRSEFQALQKVADTKQLLREITPARGLARMKEGVSLLGKMRLLLYRPLLLLAIVGCFAFVYLTVISPRRHDVEIENLEKSVPVAAPAETEEGPAPAPAPAVAAQPPASPPPRTVDRLLITVRVKEEKEAIQSINEAMREHGNVSARSFSGSVRQVSGGLPAEGLLQFLNRIEKTGKVSYNRKRFQSFPPEQQIPFILKISPAPKIAEQEAPPASAVNQAAEVAAEPASAPTSTAR